MGGFLSKRWGEQEHCRAPSGRAAWGAGTDRVGTSSRPTWDAGGFRPGRPVAHTGPVTRPATLAWSAAAACLALMGWCVWIVALPGWSGHRGVAAPVGIVAGWALTGATLVTLRPRNPIGWLLLLSAGLQSLSAWGLAFGSYGVGVADPQWPAADWAALFTSMIWLPSLVLPGTVLLALYPDGRLAARWWRWPVAAVAAGLVLITLGSSLKSSAYDDIAQGTPPVTLPDGWWDPVGAVIAFALILGGTLAIWVGTGRRLVTARSPERQQLAWLVVAVAALYVSVFGAGGALLWISSSLLPIAVGVGILRYGMLGVALSRGLTYALLTALVIAVHVGVTGIAGASLERGSPVGVAAAALVAVGLVPARERVQRGVDRFVYGERRDPIRAVNSLASQVADADQDDLLDAVVASVARSVRASGARVIDPDGTLTASCGVVDEVGASLSLRVAGVAVGELQVGPRAPGDRYSAEDLRVLAALAPQVAVVVQALDLAAELEVQRDDVVAATAAERARLRRELHDGLGPSLSGASLGLRATADALAAGRPGDAVRLVDRVRAEVDLTVIEVRQIIDGLRPLALDVDGLRTAIRRRAASLSPAIVVDVVMDDLPDVAPAVETAAYRIAGEALANVARHARAGRVKVEVRAGDDALTLRVADDGTGFVPGASPGIGLASMRRRAEALGGTLDLDTGAAGTVLTARLPLQVTG